MAELKKISDFVWEIPKSGKMAVSTRIFASEELMTKMKEDRTLKQAKDMACLPGIQKQACVMPDGHEGLFVSNS